LAIVWSDDRRGVNIPVQANEPPDNFRDPDGSIQQSSTIATDLKILVESIIIPVICQGRDPPSDHPISLFRLSQISPHIHPALLCPVFFSSSSIR
jgi:hypothetical protein